METAETHSYSKVSIQAVVPTGKQADVVGHMQDSAGQEAHQEDAENQSADSDKWLPVTSTLT